MEELKKFKERIKIYLDQNKYDLFIETITKININTENYVLYLDAIKDVMKEKFQEQNPFEVTPADKLEEAFGVKEREKTYLEVLPDLNNAIVTIFKRKLNIDSTKYEDDDISKRLDNFKERFM